MCAQASPVRGREPETPPTFVDKRLPTGVRSTATVPLQLATYEEGIHLVKRHRTLEPLLLLLVFTYFMFPKKAHAYIDPGTGSYMLQLAIGSFLAAFFVVRGYWRRLMATVRGKRGTEDAGSNSDE